MPLTVQTVPPRLVQPPAAFTASSTAATWYGANSVTFMRFGLPAAGTYQYVNFYVGTSSGNIQVGVVSFALNSDTVLSYTRVMSSGVIACPTAATPARVDCGATWLPAGDYGLFLWCDNTTATFLHGAPATHNGARASFSTGSLGSGVGTSGTTALSGRWVHGLTLESPV